MVYSLPMMTCKGGTKKSRQPFGARPTGMPARRQQCVHSPLPPCHGGSGWEICPVLPCFQFRKSRAKGRGASRGCRCGCRASCCCGSTRGSSSRRCSNCHHGSRGSSLTGIFPFPWLPYTRSRMRRPSARRHKGSASASRIHFHSPLHVAARRQASASWQGSGVRFAR